MFTCAGIERSTNSPFHAVTSHLWARFGSRHSTWVSHLWHGVGSTCAPKKAGPAKGEGGEGAFSANCQSLPYKYRWPLSQSPPTQLQQPGRRKNPNTIFHHAPCLGTQSTIGSISPVCPTQQQQSSLHAKTHRAHLIVDAAVYIFWDELLADLGGMRESDGRMRPKPRTPHLK